MTFREESVINGRRNGVTRCYFDFRRKPENKLTELDKLKYKVIINGDIAILYPLVYEVHYLHDKFHRIDGPAIQHFRGNKSWYQNGKLNRNNGPAVEYESGNKMWYLNGKLHRDNDGPAMICPSKMNRSYEDKYWYQYGKMHRDVGICSSFSLDYYQYDIKVDVEDLRLEETD